MCWSKGIVSTAKRKLLGLSDESSRQVFPCFGKATILRQTLVKSIFVCKLALGALCFTKACDAQWQMSNDDVGSFLHLEVFCDILSKRGDEI